MCCLGAAQGSETPGEADRFPSFPSQNGYTPLHQAAQQGHTHVINVLLQHGARPEATTAVRGAPARFPASLPGLPLLPLPPCPQRHCPSQRTGLLGRAEQDSFSAVIFCPQ